MIDCKTCIHAKTLFLLEKEDRFSTAYYPCGYVRCSGPRYKGRWYICKDKRNACAEYVKRERPGGQAEEVTK